MTDDFPDPTAEAHSPDNGLTDSGEPIYDREVAEWVKHAMERKAAGLMGSSAKPALHAAPLDSVSPQAV
jgi:mitogen-activated protein kinase kinase